VVQDHFLERLGGEPWTEYTGGGEEGWETDPSFLVTSPDPARAAQAFEAASIRFMCVNDSGQEFPPDEVDAANGYFPNYTTDVLLTPRGLYVGVDTKGELSRKMGQKMLDILVEEMRRVDVSAQIFAPSRRVNWWQYPKYTPGAEPLTPGQSA
jgi:hypothetical protein